MSNVENPYLISSKSKFVIFCGVFIRNARELFASPTSTIILYIYKKK